LITRNTGQQAAQRPLTRLDSSTLLNIWHSDARAVFRQRKRAEKGGFFQPINNFLKVTVLACAITPYPSFF